MKQHELPSPFGESLNPSLESQQATLAEVQTRHSDHLFQFHLTPEGEPDACIAEKAVIAHVTHLDTVQAAQSPEDTDTQSLADHDIRSLLSNPADFKVTAQDHDNGTVYSITIGGHVRVPVGIETPLGISPSGTLIEESFHAFDGFNEQDALSIRDMVQELKQAKKSGALADLDIETGQLAHDAPSAEATPPAEAMTEQDHFDAWEAELRTNDTSELPTETAALEAAKNRLAATDITLPQMTPEQFEQFLDSIPQQIGRAAATAAGKSQRRVHTIREAHTYTPGHDADYASSSPTVESQTDTFYDRIANWAMSAANRRRNRRKTRQQRREERAKAKYRAQTTKLVTKINRRIEKENRKSGNH